MASVFADSADETVVEETPAKTSEEQSRLLSGRETRSGGSDRREAAEEQEAATRAV